MTILIFFQARELSYTVMDEQNNPKTIIDDINFLLPPGSMCALMGASGAGKSTLLDVVANRKVGGVSTGCVTFGGSLRDQYFTRTSAYVMQATNRKE